MRHDPGGKRYHTFHLEEKNVLSPTNLNNTIFRNISTKRSLEMYVYLEDHQRAPACPATAAALVRIAAVPAAPLSAVAAAAVAASLGCPAALAFLAVVVGY